MMFFARGLAVSLAFFVLLYCLLSMLILASWSSLRWLRTSAGSLARILFWLRTLPLLGSLALTLVFVVPSFQLLEPRSTDEGVGALPVGLGITALLLIAWGFREVVSAQIRTSRAVAGWIRESKPVGTSPLTLRSRTDSPPLLLVGTRSPRVLVSDSTFELLTDDELEIALQHEYAHIRSWDNLKKLIFRLCPFPGMAPLEASWSQAAELAADDAAVLDANDALNLAAALVKLSRLVPVTAAPACTVGFVSGSLSERVTRLLAWSESGKQKRIKFPRWAALPTAVAAVVCAAMVYAPVLSATHEVTEWLVR